MVDGQVVTHPRRLGIVSHLGLLLTIGVAKNKLCGQYHPVAKQAGNITELWDKDEQIGGGYKAKIIAIFYLFWQGIGLAKRVH